MEMSDGAVSDLRAMSPSIAMPVLACCQTLIACVLCSSLGSTTFAVLASTRACREVAIFVHVQVWLCMSTSSRLYLAILVF